MATPKNPSKVVLLTAVFLCILFGYGKLQTCHAAETITYRLKWLFNTSVVGDLFAETHQYFSAEGLTVVLKEGGPERDAIREL